MKKYYTIHDRTGKILGSVLATTKKGRTPLEAKKIFAKKFFPLHIFKETSIETIDYLFSTSLSF